MASSSRTNLAVLRKRASRYRIGCWSLFVLLIGTDYVGYRLSQPTQVDQVIASALAYCRERNVNGANIMFLYREGKYAGARGNCANEDEPGVQGLTAQR